MQQQRVPLIMFNERLLLVFRISVSAFQQALMAQATKLNATQLEEV
jgi:hypothetical protein